MWWSCASASVSRRSTRPCSRSWACRGSYFICRAFYIITVRPVCTLSRITVRLAGRSIETVTSSTVIRQSSGNSFLTAYSLFIGLLPLM
ncbi:hypothetical protein KPB2_5536 [Klebsiella pneumoniae Kb677]|nr:hypothetical protein KPB2_5536 [Klebsiella pneumoniae Kb677]